MNKFNQAINGKKRYIGAGAGILGIPAVFLINFLMNMNTQVIATEAEAKTNTKQLEQLEEIPAQMAAIQTDVINIKEGMGELKLDQREMRQDIKEILRAVIK